MPLLRFRLVRRGNGALTTDHRASSPEELAAALDLVAAKSYWPALLCVQTAAGWWCPLLDQVPLLGTQTVLELCREVWPRAVELGRDYERNPVPCPHCGSRDGSSCICCDCKENRP